jgi:hypothetical protein
MLFSKGRSGKYVSKVVTRDNSVVLSVGTLSEYSEDKLFTIGDAVVEAIVESTNCSDLEADTVQVRIERKKITVVFDLRARFVGTVASSGNLKFSENGELNTAKFTKILESVDIAKYINWEEFEVYPIDPLDGDIERDD